MGIKKVDQLKLFSLFSTISHKDSSINPQGCGIGLTVSQKYIRRLGGKIWVESQFEVGTTVKFIVPFEAGESSLVHYFSFPPTSKYFKLMLRRRTCNTHKELSAQVIFFERLQRIEELLIELGNLKCMFC